ncbi:MAG TPA: N-acetylmuramoyl-L-alanine amidase [Spirochaetota bacterium]|nr:N-acetylmuramoyl-L-alanine amidase [Spirochaetota bacterium]HNT10113.1 N-acetylmuramoyl-L-alanine amidase [Spirochaetota bacterium]
MAPRRRHGTLRLTRCLAAALIVFICLPRTPLSPSRSDSVSLPIVRIDAREYVSLHDLVAALRIDTSFDIITQRGKLYRDSRVAVYQVGFAVALANGALVRAAYPVTRKNGEVLIPEALFRGMFSRLYPDRDITRAESAFTVTRPRDGTPRDRTKPDDRDRVDPADRRKDRIGFIVVDAGHGGHDPGAIGRGRIKEKTITLKVARALERHLRAQLPGVTVIMTRTGDSFIELGRRTEIANRQLKSNTNGIFVSIHVNASIARRIAGFETYFLSQNPTNEEARTTAALENNVVILEDRSRRKSYNDVEYVEALMLTTQIQKESALLSKTILREMKATMRPARPRGVKKADFFVLRGALMPATLVEIGYITNAGEAQQLTRPEYQRRVAAGIGNGVIEFIKKYNTMIKIK